MALGSTSKVGRKVGIAGLVLLLPLVVFVVLVLREKSSDIEEI